MLEVEDVVKKYGEVQALDGCTFSVATGRMVGLLGPNGAGKTTLMRCLLGLVEPDSGKLHWRGEAIGRRVSRRFGYMPEERGLYPSMRVLEQVVHFALLAGVDRAAAERSSREVLERVGVGSDMVNRKVEQLSHGNQQRVQLAVAMVHRPELLVLDEPFAGLDPIGVDTLARVLGEVAAGGTSVLFSSHQLDLVQDLCEEVVTIDHGRVVLAGHLEALQAESGRRHINISFTRPPAPGPSGRAWYEGLTGVDGSSAATERGVRLDVDSGVDLDTVLKSARAAGPLLRFEFEPPSLEDLFREAVAR